MASPRSEPLLWLQLLGLGVLPLEALLLLLLLAGADPGPAPALERLFCWAIGAVLPAYLLWRRPADGWSLLLLRAPLRGRRPLQLRLSSLQAAPLLQAAALGLGCVLSFALLWWCDNHAAVASAYGPLPDSPRLVVLLLAAALLALIQWQWQQWLQALWLLSRSEQQLAAAPPMALADLERQRLSLGIPLLLLAPLGTASSATAAPPTGSPPTSPAAPSSGGAAAKGPDPANDLVPADWPVAEKDSASQPSNLLAPPGEPDPPTPEPGLELASGLEPTAALESGSALEPTAVVEPVSPARAPASDAELPPLVEAEPVDLPAVFSYATKPVVIRSGASADPQLAAIPEAETELPTPGGPPGEPPGRGDGSGIGLPVAGEPEQPSTHDQGAGLDQQIG